MSDSSLELKIEWDMAGYRVSSAVAVSRCVQKLLPDSVGATTEAYISGQELHRRRDTLL
jgi:hypothetical protein